MKYLSNLIFFDAKQFIEIDAVINPLWLYVFFRFLFLKILSITNDVSDSWVIVLSFDCSSSGQYYKFKWISWNFGWKVEMKIGEQQIFSVALNILEFLINFVFLRIGFVLLGEFGEFVALIGWGVHFNGRIGESNGGIEFEVDKLEEDNIEIQESAHDSIIHIKRQVWRVFIGHNEGNFLTKDFGLVVDTFDADESSFETMGFDQIEFEVPEYFGAGVNFVCGEGEFFVAWEDGEESHEWEWVI